MMTASTANTAPNGGSTYHTVAAMAAAEKQWRLGMLWPVLSLEKRRKAQRRVGPRAVNELAHQRADDERRRGHDERGPKLSHPMPRQPGQHTQVQQVDERHGAAADEPQRLFGGWPCIEPPDDGTILLSFIGASSRK